MTKLTKFRRARAEAPFPTPVDARLPLHRHSSARRGWALVLTCVCAIALLCVPVAASAGVPEDIEAAVQEALNSLIGTEMEPVVIHFAYKPPDYVPPIGPPVQFDSVRVDITIVGFAFCNPPDPWAAPNPTPTIPFNAYGCQNLTGVDADVTPDETSATVTVSASDFFLDLAYTRDLTLACLEMSPGKKSGEAYLLTSLSITVGLALTHTVQCIQVAIVPGSVNVTLTDKGHGFLDDSCLDTAWPLYSGPLFTMANELAGGALETLLEEQTALINEALCRTPTQPATWGQVKSRFR